jgi:hypothetical protein
MIWGGDANAVSPNFDKENKSETMELRGLKLSFICGPHFNTKRARVPHKEEKCLRGPQLESKTAFILQKQ